MDLHRCHIRPMFTRLLVIPLTLTLQTARTLPTLRLHTTNTLSHSRTIAILEWIWVLERKRPFCTTYLREQWRLIRASRSVRASKSRLCYFKVADMFKVMILFKTLLLFIKDHTFLSGFISYVPRA